MSGPGAGSLQDDPLRVGLAADIYDLLDCPAELEWVMGKVDVYVAARVAALEAENHNLLHDVRTATLRARTYAERIDRAEAELAAMTAKADTYQRMYYAEHGEIAAELAALQERVAEATAEGYGAVMGTNPPADSGSSFAVISGDNIENPPADGCVNCGKPMSGHDSMAHCWPLPYASPHPYSDGVTRYPNTVTYSVRPPCVVCGGRGDDPIHQATPEETPSTAPVPSESPPADGSVAAGSASSATAGTAPADDVRKQATPEETTP